VNPLDLQPSIFLTFYDTQYTLVASNTVISPDGVDVLAMVFNESFPGPLMEVSSDIGSNNYSIYLTVLQANWGDTLSIKSASLYECYY
jgi:hypothetical protein